MPEKTSSRKQLHNRNLWQFVLLLVILVTVTVILVVTCLYQFIHHSDYEISLYQGLVSSTQASGKNSTGTARSTVSTMTARQAKEFDFTVSDDVNVWSTATKIELFERSYSNTDGKVTVRSADSNKVIAPGTEGSYTFSLKNAGKSNSNYQVWLTADMSVSSSDFPIEFRMSGADGWMTGDNGAWKTADELNSAVTNKNLYSGKTDEYTLYWRWVFDRNADEEDTSWGNWELKQGTNGSSTAEGTMGINQTVSYTVTLHTLAAEGLIGEDTDSRRLTTTPTPDKQNNTNKKAKENTDTSVKNQTGNTEQNGSAAEHSGTISKKATKTGDTTQIWSWIVLLGAAGAGIIWIKKKRKM